MSVLAGVRGAGVPRADFYVAPNGNDAWSGRSPALGGPDGPFASFGRAQAAVRELRRRGGAAGREVRVLFRGGTYRIAGPIEFTPEDSAAASAPVLYAAWPGETPVFEGAVEIQGWQPAPDFPGAWSAPMPDAVVRRGRMNQLFVNGRRRRRARSPNTGYFRIAGPLEPLADRAKARRDPRTKMGFRFRAGDIRAWPDWRNMNIVLFHAWTASIHWVAEIDEARRELRFTAPCGWPVGWWEQHARYTIENVRAALDAPGEWIADFERRRIYLIPLPGETPDSVHALTPVTDALLRFQGDPGLGLTVEHIRIEGLAFRYSGWNLPRDAAHDGQAAVSAGAAVVLRGARNCRLHSVEIAHTGTYALWLAEGAQHNTVEHCHFHDLGAGGVLMGLPRNPESPAAAAGENTVENCFIHDGGRVFRAGVGVWVGRSSGNHVAHNEICDFDYTGVSVGWSWGYAPSSANHNIIEYNHIHHIGNGVLSDLGGIYTLGVSPGTVLRGNRIHDCWAYSYGGWGLYTDEGSSDILLEGNLVYDTKSGGFHQHYGKNNVLKNNIFAFSREAQILRSREEDHLSFRFEHNIVVCDNGWVFGGHWGNGRFRLDYNLYWNPNGGELSFAGEDFAAWRKDSGQDQHSRIADPRFADAEARDFRIRPGGPADALGIAPWLAEQAGLTGDRAWIALARTAEHRRLDPAARPPHGRPLSQLTHFEDDFETTPVGERPKNAVVFAGTAGADIRVTAEQAGSGKQSLKFQDRPGQRHSWLPYMHYAPHWRRDRVVTVSFLLRLGPGAVLWHEWRDNASPYRVGPSFRVAGDGSVIQAKRTLCRIPLNQWVRFEVRCPTGQAANGVFSLRIEIPGQEPMRFPALACGSRDWHALDWLGFVADADADAVFYLDAVRLE